MIDLALGEEAVAEQVRDACLKHGFFKVKNHGVPEALRAAMMEANKRFFSLNTEQKSTILADENHRGSVLLRAGINGECTATTPLFRRLHSNERREA